MSNIEPPLTKGAQAEAEACYRDWSGPLKRFLLGVTGDADLAEDAMQSGWSKLLPCWGEVRPEARRSWLFTACYRDALASRRRRGTADRHQNRLALTSKIIAKTMQTPAAQAEHAEQLANLGHALDALPEVTRRIVRLRLEGWTFQRIADSLNLPLTTTMRKMHKALKDMRQAIGRGEDGC